jgi:LPS O-antigen subunit length determinant protein (WzzB/FepE family)
MRGLSIFLLFIALASCVFAQETGTESSSTGENLFDQARSLWDRRYEIATYALVGACGLLLVAVAGLIYRCLQKAQRTATAIATSPTLNAHLEMMSTAGSTLTAPSAPPAIVIDPGLTRALDRGNAAMGVRV